MPCAAGENTKLFVGTFGGLVHCKHVQTEQELGSVKFLNGEAVLCLAASDNPHRLAAGGMSSVVCVYDVEPTRVEGQAETCEFREILRLKTAGNVLSLTIKFDGSLLVTGGEAKMLQLWDVDKSLRSKAADNSSEGNALVREAVAQYTTATSVQSLSMLPDGSLLAVGTAEGTEVYLINRKEVWVKDSTPPGKTLAHEVAAAAQHRIVFRHFSFNDSGAGQWENEYSLEPSTWFHCSANQGGVSLARRAGRDETMLAIAGHNLISTFSLATHAPLRQMTRGGRVRCVALSRDGAIVIAGGFDKKVTLPPASRVVVVMESMHLGPQPRYHCSPCVPLLTLACPSLGSRVPLPASPPRRPTLPLLLPPHPIRFTAPTRLSHPPPTPATTPTTWLPEDAAAFTARHCVR